MEIFAHGFGQLEAIRKKKKIELKNALQIKEVNTHVVQTLQGAKVN